MQTQHTPTTSQNPQAHKHQTRQTIPPKKEREIREDKEGEISTPPKPNLLITAPPTDALADRLRDTLASHQYVHHPTLD
jgi:hypothetical protein